MFFKYFFTAELKLKDLVICHRGNLCVQTWFSVLNLVGAGLWFYKPRNLMSSESQMAQVFLC